MGPSSLILALQLLLPGVGGKPADNLSISLAFDRTKYSLGQDVWLTIELTNSGSTLLAISSSIADFSGSPGSPAMVLERDGVPVRFLGPIPSVADPSTPCSVVLLPPRHHYGARFVISTGDHGFQIDRPGRYTMRCTYVLTADLAARVGEIMSRGCAEDRRLISPWCGIVSAESHFDVLDGETDAGANR